LLIIPVNVKTSEDGRMGNSPKPESENNNHRETLGKTGVSISA